MKKNLGIYIHIPFCARKCAYCDFYSLPGRDRYMPRYQSALKRHIRESGEQLEGYFIDTVYVGGGTPSYYGAQRVADLFAELKRHKNVLVDGEFTVEVNPDSATKADLLKLRRAGFNRISIGVQSASDEMLRRLGRLHDFAKAEETVESAREAGFLNVSIDLMYGLPSQSRDDWANTLNRATALNPDHISCYGLKLAEGTELYIFKGSPFIPDDDTQADMYLYAVDMLSRYGYRQYEISNFARHGYESRHNLKYWRGEEYLGFGAAAHSFMGNRRFSYIADLERYTENILSGDAVIDMTETISDLERAGEYIMLGLRTVYGISETECRSIYPSDFSKIKERLEFYAENGFAVQENDRWRLTPKGFLVSNTIIGDLLEAHAAGDDAGVRPWRTAEGAKLLRVPPHPVTDGEGVMFRGI